MKFDMHCHTKEGSMDVLLNHVARRSSMPLRQMEDVFYCSSTLYMGWHSQFAMSRTLAQVSSLAPDSSQA